jgi:glycerol kinase
MPELLLALDAGTSQISAALFTPGGALLASASAPVRSRSSEPGRVEQDARRLWRSARSVMGAVLAQAARTPADVAAIGVTSQRASLVCWDRRTGRVLGPLISWSDLRGAARAAELRGAGFMIAPQMAAAKLEGALAAIPQAAALSARGRLAWGNIDAYLIWKLSGGALHVTDRSQAWPTGYLDLATMGWNGALIDLQGLDPASFPTLVDTWGALGMTSKAVMGAEIPLGAIVADQQSALIAHGGGLGEGAGTTKVTYGTSATLDVDTGPRLMMRGSSVPPFILSSLGGRTRFCLEGMVYSAGAALDWLRRTCGLGAIPRFEALAAATPNAQGAVFLPALQGLGAPHGDAGRRGLIAGLSAATGPGHLARAGLEGVAFRVREAFDHVFAGGDLAAPEVLRVDGGLTASETLMQAQANLLGRPIARHAIREATACGAAIGAGLGVGLLSETDASAFVRYDHTFAPMINADEADARLTAWKGAVYGV